MTNLDRSRHVRVVGWVCLIVFGLLTRSAVAQTPPDFLQDIDSFIRQVQTDWNIPGLAVGIVKDDAVVFAQGYGVRTLGQPELVDADTLFVIASNSKAFVTTSLALLVDEGKLNWDDRATTFLPELRLYDRLATQEITVRDLVCHRSGLGTFSGDLLWYETNYSPAEIIRRVEFLKPTASFRSQYGYQNLMFIAAGQIVERVSGTSCADFVRGRLLEPLGMSRTTTSVRQFNDNVATPHNESGGTMRALRHSNVDNCWGACGLNSSVHDLCQWLRFQLNAGRVNDQPLISERQLWELTQPMTPIKLSLEAAAHQPHRNFVAYGLGWVLYDYHGRKVIGHGGGLDGMISQSAFVPAEHLGIVVLTNSESPAATVIRDRILDTFLGVEPKRDWNREALERRERSELQQQERNRQLDLGRIADAPASLAEELFAGTYRCPFYGDVHVKYEGDRLNLKMGPSDFLQAELSHWHYNTFEIKWQPTVNYNFPRGFATFTQDSQGDPDQLIIDQPNDDFWFYELDLRRVK
ncbi:MAG TPA: serine hydrolase [Pirellulaceae bacterium]|nr:serine hydrolase [Pirellulaceae bacterium]